MKDSLNSKGFTLIEVLVALVILAVSLLALAGLMTTTTKNNAFGGRLTEAATFAQDKLEELRVTAWDLIVNGADTNVLRGLDYNRTWTVVAPNNREKRVTVTVNWNEGVARSINFLTVITQ